MSEGKHQEGNKIIEAPADAGFSQALEAISGLPIPNNIKKRFFETIGQLFTAAVDWPVAWLQDRAAEVRALTATRENIISAAGSQIETEMDVDPKFAQAAATTYAQKIIREQVNLNKITKGAAQQFLSDAQILQQFSGQEDEEEQPINADWLNYFEREASKMSSEMMQALFSKILAGEIIKPKSFSNGELYRRTNAISGKSKILHGENL